MTFYVPPGGDPQKPTIYAEFFCGVALNLIPQPGFSSFTILPITAIFADPFGIIANPATIDPVNNPQIILPDNDYRTVQIELRCFGSPTGSKNSVVGGHYSVGAGFWSIDSRVDFKANELLDACPMQLPIFSTENPAPTEITMGLNTDFGSGRNYNGLGINGIIKAWF